LHRKPPPVWPEHHAGALLDQRDPDARDVRRRGHGPTQRGERVGIIRVCFSIWLPDEVTVEVEVGFELLGCVTVDVSSNLSLHAGKIGVGGWWSFLKRPGAQARHKAKGRPLLILLK